jgi:hypothetical protein
MRRQPGDEESPDRVTEPAGTAIVIGVLSSWPVVTVDAQGVTTL